MTGRTFPIDNKLLHEIKIKNKKSIWDWARDAGVWQPHIQCCLLNERQIGLAHLIRLGDAVGYELVWKRKNRSQNAKK